VSLIFIVFKLSFCRVWVSSRPFFLFAISIIYLLLLFTLLLHLNFSYSRANLFLIDIESESNIIEDTDSLFEVTLSLSLSLSKFILLSNLLHSFIHIHSYLTYLRSHSHFHSRHDFSYLSLPSSDWPTRWLNRSFCFLHWGEGGGDFSGQGSNNISQSMDWWWMNYL
jgi:hypothetical protein